MKLARLSQGPEIFASIQGEGRNVGQFSVFVRASLCNLHCVWCDTDYTWNWTDTPFKHVRDSEPAYHKFERSAQIVELSATQIAETVKNLRSRNVVLTGGEPLLQQEEFRELMELLLNDDSRYSFEVETNGTIEPSAAFDNLVFQYNVSPKLANSTNRVDSRLRQGPLRFFADSPKAWFKFVCDNVGDVDEVSDIVSGYDIRRERVFLMPVGSTSEQIHIKSQDLVKRCIEHGFNFSDRLHIHLFKNERGK